MASEFESGVFPSYSTKDKAIVRPSEGAVAAEGAANCLLLLESQPVGGSDWTQLFEHPPPSTLPPQPSGMVMHRECCSHLYVTKN